jgi:hypothetical protein
MITRPISQVALLRPFLPMPPTLTYSWWFTPAPTLCFSSRSPQDPHLVFLQGSPQIILRMWEIISLASLAAQAVLTPPPVVCLPSGYGPWCSKASSSLLSHGSSQSATSRGADPPSLGVVSRSSAPLLVVSKSCPSHSSPPPMGPHHPDPGGVAAPSPSGGVGLVSGLHVHMGGDPILFLPMVGFLSLMRGLLPMGGFLPHLMGGLSIMSCISFGGAFPLWHQQLSSGTLLSFLVTLY